MRWIVLVAFAILVAACGGPSVEERVDDLQAAHHELWHGALPAPWRKAELFPGDEHLRFAVVREKLLAHEDGRALLEAGERVVPTLIRLLDDFRRQRMAAVLLAEIGGPEAARALLDAWRADRLDHYKQWTDHPIGMRAGEVVYGQFHTLHGPRPAFYEELVPALCFAGLPVCAAIAGDTRAAIEESERRLGNREPLYFERERADGAVVASRHRSTQTATEGIQILAMLGAPEAVDVLRRALASRVVAVRWAAIQNAYWLGERGQTVIPHIGALLDDPRVRSIALRELHLMLGLPRIHGDLADDEETAAVLGPVREQLPCLPPAFTPSAAPSRSRIPRRSWRYACGFASSS